MGFWAAAAPALIGGAMQIGGGLLGDSSAKKEAKRQREHEARLAEMSQQTARETAGNRGWQDVDPLLQFGIGEAKRVYNQRLKQGPYAKNVGAPSSGSYSGASSDQRELAGRAKDLAMAGPGQAATAGMDYVTDTLGGGGPAGGSADYYRRGAEAYAGLPGGQAAGMYRQGFGQAATGGNEYIPRVFDMAQDAFGNWTQAGTGTGGGAAGAIGGGSGINPNAYNINPDDPRFAIDEQGYNVDTQQGLLGAPEALDSQGYVGEALGANAPVGTSADIRAMLDNPFAVSNPELENMIRLQQQDLSSAHEAELGRLAESASNVGAYGGSDFQLAQAQMASDLGRNTERAGTNLRYDDYNRRIADKMSALGMGQQMDLAAMAQAAELEIFNRSDLTDRQKADLNAQVQRQLANQGAQVGIAQGNQGVQTSLALGNQGTQAGLASTGASLDTQRAIANQSNALSRDSLAQRSQADYLQAMLGAAGLQNDAQLGRLGLMGQFASGMGGLEEAGAAGQIDAAGGLGALEQGALGAIPGLEGIEMGKLGAASDLTGQVARQDAAARSAAAAARQRWQQEQLQWDYNRQANALDDLINQGLRIGSHVQTPAGLPSYMQPGAGAPQAGGASVAPVRPPLRMAA